MATARKAKAPKAEKPEIFEMFIKPWISNKPTEPSCFNGRVNVRKYRVTIELVEEPIEVIQQRIQDMWDRSDNYHDHEPLVSEAKKYGYELKGSRGSKKKQAKR